jgi:hypothetical protein
MKNALAVFSEVLALTLVSLAQDAATTATTSVTGCLAGSAAAYTLTDQTGKSYVLTGNTDDLAGHVGHQMEVTGQSPPSPNTSQTASGTASFEVAGAKMISDQCAAETPKAASDKGVAVGVWDKGTTDIPAGDTNSESPGPEAATVNQTPPTTGAATSQTTVNQPEPAAAPAPPQPETPPPQNETAAPPPPKATVPQTASPLPLFGILAVGSLCAGYLTLRTN